MKIIPKKQLEDLGFIEVKENLFLKKIDSMTELWRDYRDNRPVIYGYRGRRPIDVKRYRETYAIEKIEQAMIGMLDSYIDDTSKSRSLGVMDPLTWRDETRARS